MTMLEAIEHRRSVRNFEPEFLTDSDAAYLNTKIAEMNCGPFGNTVRMTILRPTAGKPDALNGLGGSVGTYGFIKNAQAYAVGATKPAPFALHDYGFIMEGIVLEAAQLGVGSCWLGGSFRPGPFGKAIAVQEKEFVPAVIALGYPGQKRRIADKLIEMHHNKANRRAEWETRFFKDNDFAIPAGSDPLLRAVHLAPSSCNTQPWRIAKDGDHCFHFFFQRNRSYSQKDKLIGNADLQQIDMGIAMRHFEIAAQACEIKGAWCVLENTQTKNVPAKAEYLVSWLSDC